MTRPEPRKVCVLVLGDRPPLILSVTCWLVVMEIFEIHQD